MKIIAVGGVAIIGLMMLIGQTIQRGLQPNEAQRVGARPAAANSPFNGERAYADLHQIVALGPRPSGSEAHARMRDYLKRELAMVGVQFREHSFTANTPLGPIPMVNVYAIVQGNRPGTILIGNHYETKLFKDFTFVGANDGGSTTAWMLEFARAVGSTRQGRSLWLCWFDGEEAFVEWSPTDSLYGSRAFVRFLAESKQLQDVHAMINVDMIGDCYLGIIRDPVAPKWLDAAIWGKAQALGYGKHFLASGQVIEDDHIPFRNAGIPAIELIDFRYGGSIADHNRNWHTPLDTIDRVCPGSLQAVGDVIYHALGDIDAALDAGNARQR